MHFETLTSLYQYLDKLVEEDVEEDILFSSSYVRSFISLVASDFSDERCFSEEFIKAVDGKLYEARAELNPQDRIIVNQYWQILQTWLKA